MSVSYLDFLDNIPSCQFVTACLISLPGLSNDFFDRKDSHAMEDFQSWYWFAALSSHWGLDRIIDSLVQQIHRFSI